MLSVVKNSKENALEINQMTKIILIDFEVVILDVYLKRFADFRISVKTDEHHRTCRCCYRQAIYRQCEATEMNRYVTTRFIIRTQCIYLHWSHTNSDQKVRDSQTSNRIFIWLMKTSLSLQATSKLQYFP